jgi:hypothetical protein
MPRKKRSKYEWVHKDYLTRVARVHSSLAYKTAHAMRKHGDVPSDVIRRLGAYRLDDPVMPELYDTLNLYHNMYGEQAGPGDVVRLYVEIKERQQGEYNE